MDRRQRISSRAAASAGRLEAVARALDRAMKDAGVGPQDREVFLKWAAGSLWQKFKEERMENRIEIENEIRRLGIRFPNGTVNKEYHAGFSLPSDKISDVRLLGAEELGLKLLSLDDGRFTLDGIPSKAGDFTLTLSFNTVEGEPASEMKIPVAFNRDPRELWKDIPTDPDIPYFKSDTACEYIKVQAGEDGLPKKDLVGASMRGRSHAHEGRPRDDHFRLFHCDSSDWYILAVADGAGSAKFSRKGAEVACNTVVEHCSGLLLDNPDFEDAVKAFHSDKDSKEKRTEVTRHVINVVYNGALRAHEAIKKVASANEDSCLKDFATTLMFAICKRFDFGWFVASFWVGDGAMAIYNGDENTVKLLGTPDEGEFSGQTRFLTMPEIFHDKDVVSKRLRMSIVPDFTALFLMTDGVSDPMFETDRNLNDVGKWKEFYCKLKEGFPGDGIEGVDLSDDNEEARLQLLEWLRFWSPGNHDDRTIAMLY